MDTALLFMAVGVSVAGFYAMRWTQSQNLARVRIMARRRGNLRR